MSNKLRVFVDISILREFKGNLTGISRTIYNLTRNLILEHSDRLEVGFICFDRDQPRHQFLSSAQFIELVRKVQPTDLPGLTAAVTGVEPRPPGAGDYILILGEQWLYPDSMSQIEALKDQCGVRVASLIYDLVPFLTRQYHWEGFTDAFEKCILATARISDVLLSISESTQRDLIHVANQNDIQLAARMGVVRLGDNFFTPEMIKSAPSAPITDYILCVGTIQPRKNHWLLVFAWKLLHAELGPRTPKLVILGNRGWHVDDLFYFVQNDPQLRDSIVFKTESSDLELVSYYQGCRFSLFPSFYEGWGLPVAESVSLGKFCIASNSSSMPEIAGDLIDYHSPYDSGELARRVLHYLQNPADLRAREQRIQAEYRTTTWKDFTRQLVGNLT